MEDNKVEDNKINYIDDTPLKQVLFGLFLMGGATYLFFYFKNIEQSGERVNLYTVLTVAYELLGKNIICGSSGLFGLFMLYLGIANIVKEKKKKK